MEPVEKMIKKALEDFGKKTGRIVKELHIDFS